MRRARGCGGRFLNTKKLENSNSDGKHNDPKPSAISGSSHASECLLTSNENSSGDHHDAMVPTIQNMQKAHSFPTWYNDDNGLALGYHSPLGSKKDGDCFPRETENLEMHGAPNGAIK